ncbi:MAG: GNAT family N-acetyltransferase [Nocardioidaceae bacterium]|nr:GNAT family N-acetyltransferase [Nocardioidaceae bacterium]
MRFPDDVPTLSSGDVTLRAHRLDDLDAMVEQCVDPVSVQWTTVPLGFTRDNAVEFASKTVPQGWESGHELAFAIESTHPGGKRRFSGTVSLVDRGGRRAEIAFGAHPAVRGRGVMTTSVNLLLDWGFAERGLETVLWMANKDNYASRRIAWRTGFTFAGTARRWMDHRGDYPDGWGATLHRDDSREPKSAWYDVPVIAGDRVTLRALAEKDAPAIVEACSDERTRHWLAAMPDPYTEQDASEYMQSSAARSAGGEGVNWAVADNATAAFLANVGLPRMGRTDAEIGYWTHPAARGRGVMTEAVALVVRHAFIDVADGGLGLRRVWLKAAVGNTASQQVARANGFTEYGRERKSERLGDGSYGDMLLFDLLASEHHP